MLFYFITVTFVSGCIAIPHPTVLEELPFKDKDLAFIKTGVTSREEVRQRFGTECVTRGNGQFVVYGEPRTFGGWLIGTFGGGSAYPITTEHLLIIRYDNNEIVVDYEVLREDEKCIENGICIEPFYGSIPSTGWFNCDEVFDDAILYDISEEDEQLKLFIAPSENCGFYFFMSGDKSHHRLSGNDMTPNIINEKYYLYRESNPGKIELWVTSPTSIVIFTSETGVKDVGTSFSKVTLNCEPGNLLFIKATYKNRKLKENELSISVVSEEEGKQEVLKRRLIIH